MKKKNVLMMALSLALVAVIAVGGTLAYLTSTTGPVTNTFYGSAGIAMTLDEAKVGDDGQALSGASSSRVDSNSYTVLPGINYDKDPTLHITSVPANGADVYVKITGLGEHELYDIECTLNNKLNKVEGYTDLYRYEDVVTADKLTGESENKKFDIVIFDGIKFDFTNDDASKEEFAIDNIVVTAYAVQAGLTAGSDGVIEDTTFATVDEMAADALHATTAEP